LGYESCDFQVQKKFQNCPALASSRTWPQVKQPVPARMGESRKLSPTKASSHNHLFSELSALSTQALREFHFGIWRIGELIFTSGDDAKIREPFSCRRFCVRESLRLQQIATAFNDRLATSSISITQEPQISTDVNNVWNLVRDQGVGGSNPLSPTNFFQHASAPKSGPLGFWPGALPASFA
jgi:hypothetical protein